MAECFEFFDLKSRIMTSFDTLPLDVNFGHLLTGSNFSDRTGGGGGNGDGGGNNNRDNGGGGGRRRERVQARVRVKARQHTLQRALHPRPQL